MRTWLLVLTALMATTAAAVPVWRWVDDTGQVHYSDRPVPGAEQIEVAAAQSFPSASTRSAEPSSSDPPAEAQPAAVPYRRFDVISPAQQETLWNIGAMLSVQVDLEPALQAGHHIDISLDGQRRNLNAASAQFTVPEVYRGVHTLQAVIVDANGNEVLRSLVVTFMVQQTSILNPNNPNAPANGN